MDTEVIFNKVHSMDTDKLKDTLIQSIIRLDSIAHAINKISPDASKVIFDFIDSIEKK